MKQLVYEYWLSCLSQCSEEKTDRAIEVALNNNTVAVIRKDYDMENIIPMKRRQVKDFLDTYTIKFLRKHNFLKIDEKVSFSLITNNHIVFIAVVKTKYGYMAVGKNNLVTYVGDGIWSVSKDE